MKIVNYIQDLKFYNYKNAKSKKSTEPVFKSKPVIIKTLPEKTIKIASLVASSIGLATLAIANKTSSNNETTIPKETTNQGAETPPTTLNEQQVITPPAQLSLFHMHDFHGQSVRMERATTASEDFQTNKLNDENFFEKSLPIDKLKLCSGDMFLSDNPRKIAIVNDFLNDIEVTANVVGNHECDASTADFAELIRDKKYRLIATNIHPEKGNAINHIVSDSFITEVNGNKYGIIGVSPIDFMKHTSRPEEISSLNIDNLEQTITEIQTDINDLRQKGVNKIILLSHLGIDFDKQIARRITDLDVILGGHTHTLFKEATLGENLFLSPKGEPVLVVQSGKDGEYIGIPNLKFNELGQITEIDYNIIRTDDFARNEETRLRFQRLFGASESLGTIGEVASQIQSSYISENPHASFLLDCLKEELNTDIAVINAASIRGDFCPGELTSYDLDNISPFTDNAIIIKASEKEIVAALKEKIKTTVMSSTQRPGILQVSGLKYKFDKKTGELLELKFVDKSGKERLIDIENPSEQLYTVAVNEFCAKDPHSGLGLEHRVENPVQKFDYDIKNIIVDWLKKNKKPINIKLDGRIVSE